MTNTIKISTKIKIFGTLIAFLVAAIVFITIFLNNQTSKDALVVNIVGKQRMLSQKIAKNIFYIHYTGHKDFYELNSAIKEFNDALNLLEHGDSKRDIFAAPNTKISNQLQEVKRLWENYHKEIQNFKILCMNYKNTKTENNLKKIILRIYKTNPILLENIDKLVTLYTENSEDKINNIKIAQYIFLSIFVFSLAYILLQLKLIESHVDNFINYYKQVIKSGDISKLEPMNYEAGNEEEIVEINETINSFIEKINTAVNYSSEAGKKLEDLTEEFESIIDSIQNSPTILNQFDSSDNMIEESSEQLYNATKKLQKLKIELEKLSLTCKPDIK